MCRDTAPAVSADTRGRVSLQLFVKFQYTELCDGYEKAARRGGRAA